MSWTPGVDRHLDLGADAVGRGHEHRLAVAREVGAEHAAEGADLGQHRRVEGRLREGLDAGLGRVGRGDVDAGVAVVHGKAGVYRQPAPEVRWSDEHGSSAALRVRRLERTLEERRQQVEAALRRLVVPGRAAAVEAAVETSLFAPAKRLRPMLSLLVAEVLKGDPEAVLPAGCAIEMVHTASLILDDLPSMDDAKTRRGRPTCHVPTARRPRSWPRSRS